MRRPIVVLIAALLACAPAAAYAANATPAPGIFDQLRFRNVGPQVSGGRLGAVAGSDRDLSLYYAGAAGGGVWKTTNAGQSWEPVFDKQDVQSIGAIAIDPANENVVWVGTGEGAPRNDVIPGDGVYRTSDGGRTWQRVLALSSALVAKIEIDPRDPNTVLVGVLGDPFADSSDRGMYRTSDGGETWHKTLYVDARTGVSDMDASRTAPGVVFAGMWTYRRTGWSSQSGSTQGGLYKSTDFGATWQRLTGGGLPSGATGRIGIAVAPSNDRRVYALIESKAGLLWRSDDGGATWQMISDNTLIDERPFYYTHVFVDPTNQDHLWSLSVQIAVSSDGGKTWKIGAHGVHGDNHAMWISRDAKRILEANDGGPSFSFDDGKTWQMPHNLPIAQLYHIGFDRGHPYHICAPLQDNGVWCAPGDALAGSISSSDWHSMGGGDGTWAVPDPADSRYVWFSSGGGNFAGDTEILDRVTSESRDVSPYVRDQNVVDPKNLKYRFNWETPIAFDPFDPHVVYLAGNVVFVTRDRGYHWKRISGDLTRNQKAHEVVTGGITLDGTGAETSDTILYLAPSPARRGELWAGTDDGVIQLTLDGGKHWRSVTPPVANRWGRFASLSASKTDAATLYAAYDLHMVGDRTPHVYATHDYGAHWTDLAAGLPRGNEVRSIRQDPKNPRILYAGLEQGLWASFDGGAHWRDLRLNIPSTSVRDIRVQPDMNDLLVATHGRAVYVLDDLTPLQHWPVAKAQIFPVRAAIQWNTHTYYATPADGSGPPYGAIVTYYLPREEKNVRAEILDASGRVVRRFDAKQAGGQAGFNRFTWDMTGEPPQSWNFTPKWNQGFDSGAAVLPGTYTAVVHAGPLTLRTAFPVRQDPRTHYTLAQLAANRNAVQLALDDFSRTNDALNRISTILNEAPLRVAVLNQRKDGTLALRVADASSKAKLLLLSITQNPQNDQDDDFLTDILRERWQTQIESFNAFGPPTQAQLQENASLHALTLERLRAVAQFERGTLHAVDEALRAQRLAPLTTLTQKPVLYDPNASEDDE
ncbi:MAG TPA: hypothetical protein VJP85_08645 [Candidatus Baltobacteraceae bacterium]|nr:hypothetical protein [Candidatus Baltobacteraceae bacterium]